MSPLWRQNKAQSCQRRAEISKQICFLRLKKEKKPLLIFLFESLNPFRRWFLICPQRLAAGLELKAWISRLRTELSCWDLQVGKTLLNMGSNLLTCWRSGRYVTCPRWNHVGAGFCLPETSDPVFNTPLSASTIPSSVPAPLCSAACFRLSGWQSERWDVLLGWPTCQEVSSEALFELWWLKLGPGGSVWHRLTCQPSDTLLSACFSWFPFLWNLLFPNSSKPWRTNRRQKKI